MTAEVVIVGMIRSWELMLLNLLFVAWLIGMMKCALGVKL